MKGDGESAMIFKGFYIMATVNGFGSWIWRLGSDSLKVEDLKSKPPKLSHLKPLG